MLGRSWPLLLLLAGLLGTASGARGQEDLPVPILPLITPTTVPTDRLEAIEARLRALENQNRQLSEENQELRRLIDSTPSAATAAEPILPEADRLGTGTRSVAEAAGELPGPRLMDAGALPDGPPSRGGTTFSSTPDSPVPSYMSITPGRPRDRVPILGSFGQGFEFESEDEEFMLQVHLESQTDYRAFDPSGEGFARNGFFAPRNRILFGGRATRSVEYLLSINRGFGDLNLLDAWLNFRSDDRIQFKIGRFMTPFNYEQFAIQNMWLIAPERSLFTSNLGLNRQYGAMLWGSAFDKRVDYAIGAFNGPRNSFEDFNNAKDVIGYLNVRPFQEQAEGGLLRLLNLGGSFSYGAQDNPLVPAAFRVATNASNAGSADRAAPPFLAFNDGVIERGQRTLWSAHLAYFYRSLSVVADYNGGILRYARNAAAPSSAVLPTHGMSIAAGYFLTGERPERRTIVEPLRPFRLGRGEFGPGAVELVGRYSTFDVDSNVFDAGLADRALWSNRAWITNLGVNWYPNEFVKIYLTWQHAEFGDPVVYALPDRRALTNEMLWLRFQFYY